MPRHCCCFEYEGDSKTRAAPVSYDACVLVNQACGLHCLYFVVQIL